MSRVTQLMARARATAPAAAPGSDAALLTEALTVLRVLHAGEVIRTIERRLS